MVEVISRRHPTPTCSAGACFVALAVNGPLGSGREYTVEPVAPWPWWASFLLLLGAAQLAVLFYLLERGGYQPSRLVLRLGLAGIRFALAAILVFMLHGLATRPYETDPADLLILIDDSASMGHTDLWRNARLKKQLASRIGSQSLTGLSRLTIAKSLLLDEQDRLLADLERRYNLKLFFVGESARMQSDREEPLSALIRSAEAEGATSRLGQAVIDCLEAQRGAPTAAIVLFTDGVTTDGPSLVDAAQAARRRGVPLFLVGLGESAAAPDLRVSDLLASDVVFANDLATFVFRVGADGFQGSAVEARLVRTDTGETLDRATIEAPADGQTEQVTLRHRPAEVGEWEYTIEIAAAGRKGSSPPKEARLDNNRLRRTVSVRDETIRVLYVQEYPSGDFRFLKHLLGRSLKTSGPPGARSIELTTVLQDADARYAATDESAVGVFPVSREELFQFDVVLFGDVDPARLGNREMENLADFVSERGGGIAFIAGPRHTPLDYQNTPLAPLFPFDLATASAPAGDAPLATAFRPQRTRLGEATAFLELADSPQESRRIWQSLPGMYWLLEAPDLKSGVRVLLAHPTATNAAGQPLPVLCRQYVGAGKVLFLASDDSWRWRFRAGDRYFARFWVQAIRDLASPRLLRSNQPVELSTDRREYQLGDTVRLAVRYRDDRAAGLGVSVTLRREGSPPLEVALTPDEDDRNRFSAALSDLAAGEYRVRLLTGLTDSPMAETSFTVASASREMTRLEMNAAELKQAARISQGKFYTAENGGRWMRETPQGRTVRVRPLPLEPLWNLPLVAGIFIALIALEWVLRRRAGML